MPKTTRSPRTQQSRHSSGSSATVPYRPIWYKDVRLLFSLLVVFVASATGSMFTMPNIPGWYATLNKSPLNPPNWVFGPVWTLLFTLMGIALYVIVRFRPRNPKGVKSRSTAISIFLMQLSFNVMWSMMFFAFQSPPAALFTIAALWFLILLTIFTFFRISRKAGVLLIPYLLWVSFAWFLNFEVVVRN